MEDEDYIREQISDLIDKQDDIDEDQYPEVPVEDMPDGVKEEIERFKQLDDEQRDPQILLYWLLGGRGTPPYKMSKEESEYESESDGEEYCGNCEYAYYSNETGELICSQIRGKIDWEGWCKLWDYSEPDDVLQQYYEDN